VGEFLILLGSWPFSRTLVAVASLGVVLAAAYILWMVQRVLYGEVTVEKNRTLPDLSARELAVVVPLVALALFMGVASPFFTRKIEPAVDALVLRTRGPAHSFAGTVAAPAPAPLAASARP
jgi:NADH-quinone oxidoreductase subunit M